MNIYRFVRFMDIYYLSIFSEILLFNEFNIKMQFFIISFILNANMYI